MGVRTESFLTAPLRTVAKFFTGRQLEPRETAPPKAEEYETGEPLYGRRATATASRPACHSQHGVAAPLVDRGPSFERKEAGATSPPQEPLPGLGSRKASFGTGRRRSPRILVSVPIRVTAGDASGVAFIEDTATVSISLLYGIRISLTRSLLPDDIVLIKNLESGIEENFRVVGGFEQVIGGRREWGLEAVNPASNIWGAQFAPAAERIQPQALIECAACKTKAYSPVTSIEYEVLLSIGMVSRHCDRCGETTRWKPSLPSPADAKMVAGEQPTRPQLEQRREHRLSLTLRLRVRNARGLAEIVHTRDVSKEGLCFASLQSHEVGDELYITFLSSNGHAPFETKGKIAWSGGGPGNRTYGVGFLR